MWWVAAILDHANLAYLGVDHGVWWSCNWWMGFRTEKGISCLDGSEIVNSFLYVLHPSPSSKQCRCSLLVSLFLTHVVEEHSGKLSVDEVKMIREEVLWKYMILQVLGKWQVWSMSSPAFLEPPIPNKIHYFPRNVPISHSWCLCPLFP